MGISPFKVSRSTYDPAPAPQSNPNPNPLVFSVLRSRQIGNNLLVEVEYPGCTNFEGRKIMVYLNATIRELLAQGSIDPHFSSSTRHLSPYARFRPTRSGWDDAILFCEKVL